MRIVARFITVLPVLRSLADCGRTTAFSLNRVRAVDKGTGGDQLRDWYACTYCRRAPHSLYCLRVCLSAVGMFDWSLNMKEKSVARAGQPAWEDFGRGRGL